MHRVILGLEHGDPRQGDHVNGVRLDNRRANLRIVTPAGNAQNRTVALGSSRFVGVSKRADTGRYVAYLKVDGVMHRLGEYAQEADAAAVAAQARDRLMPTAVADPALLNHVVDPSERLTQTRHVDRADEIVARWARGDSLQEIADWLGCSRNSVGALMTRLRARGYELPYRRAGWA